MSVYVGSPTGTSGLVDLPMCFTGWHALIVHNLIIQVEVVSGMIVGLLVALLATFFFGAPEIIVYPPVPIGVAILGAILGGAFGIVLLNKSMCPCPAGSFGFCVCLMMLVVPGTTVGIPLYPFFKPCPGSCATLVPAGCP